MTKFIVIFVLAAASVLVVGMPAYGAEGPPAVAQENYPSSPIRVVLGFPPGATTDVLARQLAQRLSVQMNTNAFVDNKPGANSNIGADVIVSGDAHLLVLKRFHGIDIIAPAEALRRFGISTSSTPKHLAWLQE